MPRQKSNDYYKKTMVPQAEGYVDSAPHTATQQVVVDAPASDVWALLDDSPSFTTWFPGVKSASIVVPSETGLHAKRLAQLNRIKYYEDVIAYRPNEAWGFTMLESTSGACQSIAEVIYLEAIDDTTTRVTYKGGYEFAGPYRPLAGTLSRQIAKVWSAALAGLKAHVETQPVA